MSNDDDMGRPTYRGRFAPSPTGPLHFGSLVAALASYLEARAANGEWLVRIEDLDRPRCRSGAAEDILGTLAAMGFEWDGEVAFQSARLRRYGEALERLRRAGRVFPCACTRQEFADSMPTSDGAPRYPGTCRNGLPAGRTPRSERLSVGDACIAFEDRVQGRIAQDVARDVGDFVLVRADGIFAYQLAVVVDDCEQGITEVVRGADLLHSTPRQILLQRLLGCPTPSYAHVPVALDACGLKLSKRTEAQAVSAVRPVPALHAALAFLGQQPPAELKAGTPAELWRWAHAHWRLARVPRVRVLPAPAIS